MNIAIIHLSDLHVSSKEAVRMDKVDKLLTSLNVLGHFEGAVFVLSGDVAARGLPHEYKLASQFIGSIYAGLIGRFHLRQENIKVAIAPGNHDIDKTVVDHVKRENVVSWYKDATIDEKIEQEILRMGAFYDFANRHTCFLDKQNPLFCRKLLPFIDEKCNKVYIEINLLNTAPFSSDDDKGIHYLPDAVFENYMKSKKTPLSITVMHHPPDWFNNAQKIRLQNLIYSRSSIALFGHEHYEESQNISLQQGDTTAIQCGGSWWNKSFENSSFFAGLLDTSLNQYAQYEFKWDNVKEYYHHREIRKNNAVARRNDTQRFLPQKEYMDYLCSDERHPVCKDITKYFTFPQLRIEATYDYDGITTIQTLDELIRIVEESPQIMIVGRGGAGKTMLSRMLFRHLIEKYTVLLCGVDEISGKNQRNIIRNTFADIYGMDEFPKFEQLKSENKVIIIDDFNLIKSAHLSKLLQGLGEIFGHIVLIGEKNSTFDVREQISEELKLEKGIKQLSISRFFADKRGELIGKVIDSYGSGEIGVRKETLRLHIENALCVQGLTYALDPDFVVKFTSYYCSHAHELKSGNINVFSKVFEASIELAILPCLHRETVGQIKSALSEVAYYIHFNKAYPISADTIEDVVNDYSTKYDEPLNPKRFLEIAEESRILTKCQDNTRYRFKNKDHLAYFVADAVMRRFNEGNHEAEENLCEIIEFSCFSINPTILKFIAYTTNNIKIIEMLLAQALQYVSDWPEYVIDEIPFSYLNSVPEFERRLDSNSKKAEIEAKTNHEKKEAQNLPESDLVETIDIYDYDTDDLDKLNNQLIRAHLQMNTISSCLVTFSHMMPAKTKKELITAIYRMPNQIFHKWAKQIDVILEELVEEFWEDDAMSGINKEEERVKILSAMQRISVNLLLNLYYSVALNSATSATIENLRRDEYIISTNSRLQRLMFLEYTDQYKEFIAEAEAMDRNAENGITKNMVRSMVYHLLLWSPSLPQDRQQHLIDKYKLGNKKTAILLQNSRNK